MGYGDGSLFKNDRGTWTMFVTIDGRRYKRTAATKTAVRTKVADLRNQIAAGTYETRQTRTDRVRASDVRIAEAVEDWLARDMPARDLAPATEDRHRQAAKHAVRLLGQRRVSDLTVRDVENAYEQLADEGQSRASIVKVRNLLSLTLKAAVRRGDLARNVAPDAQIPASAARTAPRKSLGPDDARTLLAALRDERNGLAFALSLRTGLRPGEAWALWWDDLEDGLVNVVRSIRRSGGRAEIVDDLKTSAARRTIALPPDLVRWTAEHRAAQASEQLEAREWGDPRLVFASPVGTLVDPKRSRTLLADILDRTGLPTVTPNELRHSCASLLADEGVPNELIADLLGHTTTRMVDQTYRHRLRPVVDVAERATWATATLP
ncbi:MAG: site-specific integrase [Actinomycetota bacterium]